MMEKLRIIIEPIKCLYERKLTIDTQMVENNPIFEWHMEAAEIKHTD
jgi:hypothetical protein